MGAKLDLSHHAEDVLLSAISASINHWIRNEGANPARLAQWLRGDLPIGETGDEPYVWLLKSVEASGAPVERALASAAARILDSVPERAKGDRQERLLYNLLRLCAGLEAPVDLARSLLAMLDRKTLADEYNGLDLRNDLRAALARNQVDQTLAGIWTAMLEDKPSGFLPGGIRDGFDGIVRMPAALGSRVRVEDLVYAIDRMIPVFERSHDASLGECKEELADSIKQISSIWGWPAVTQELLREHSNSQWPEWVIETLGQAPETSSEFDSQVEEQYDEILWEAIHEAVNDIVHMPFQPSERTILGVAQQGLRRVRDKHFKQDPGGAKLIEEIVEYFKRPMGVAVAERPMDIAREEALKTGT